MNINVDAVGTTGAQLSWNVQSGFASVPTSYYAEVTDVLTGASMGTYTPSINQTLVTGLTPNTDYKFRVRPSCENENGGWDSVVFSTNGMPCLVPDPNSTSTLTLNDGTSGTDYYLPLNNYYNYSYTQQLILASEMNGPSTITGIDFQYNYSTAMTSKTNCTIYLANVSVSDLSSGFVPYSASTFQAVYTGTLNCNSSNSGWNHFNFTTPFVYTGGNLLIVVHDNSGSYNSSSYVFTHHSTTGTMGRHIYNDSSPYTISSVSGGNGVSYRNNMKLYTYGCLQAGTCAAPLVVIDSMGSDYIDVSWAPGYQESSWTVEYRRDDSTTWTSLGTTTSMSTSITGLTPNYTYHVRVTSHCTDTDMASTITARTPCVPDTLPFFTSFEDFAGSSASYAMPTCWERHSNYGNYYPYSSTSYVHSGSKSVYVYSTNTSWSYFTLPPFDAPVDSLYVNFWLLKANTSYAHAIKVGVMTDPEDVSTFTEIGTATPQNLYEWENFEFYLDSYTGTGRYIAIMSPSGVYSYPYLDDLTVDRIPDCRRVQGIVVDAITQNSAHASWVAGDVTEFEVVCVPFGMAPDSGNIVTVYDDSLTVTGLTHSTAYQLYVRAHCASGDTSDWSVASFFRTTCGMIDSLPYTEDLEAVAPGSSNTGTSFIPCWTRINNGTSYGGYPYVSSSTTYNHTPGGNRGLYWYNTTTTGSYGDYEYVVFPQIDTATLPINAIQLSFWAKSSSTTYYPVFEVGVMRDVNDTAMDVLRTFDVNPDGTASWHEFVVPFGRYSGNGSYIGIRAL
ncbi:MAG: fibronectin type III domain-containing protein, partial [Bacteroidales bacterium]|nr:fibronectin type III domain-containing protein [Bacteroidales bacterium]